MNEKKIRFGYKDDTYEIEGYVQFFDGMIIQIAHNVLLQVSGLLESYPPSPAGFTEIKVSSVGSNCVKATKVECNPE